MEKVLHLTEEDLDLPKTQPQILASMVIKMFDGKTPVRTLQVAKATGRSYDTVKTHLHRAGRLGLLRCVLGKGWLPPEAA